jgi:hypothetical protein
LHGGLSLAVSALFVWPSWRFDAVRTPTVMQARDLIVESFGD